jgi:two-component system response regulator (stage 0 sporulation protein F)
MKNILLVEDEEVQRILYEEELTDSGYEVRSASSGKEALKMIKKRRPDLVILDILLPNMSGLDAIHEMLNFDPKLHVIINSAYSHYKDDFMSWAADDYVVKSSDLSELKNAIK